ncbi:MAG: glycosyltransferase family 4 protein [Chloroflexota bacterium]|nr:glycosyltransferase family 4 protein [Chloroflexota bacterium]
MSTARAPGTTVESAGSDDCMNLVVFIEHRFDQTPDGAVWTQTMFARPFWSRYLDVFDHVRVVARLRTVATVPGTWQRADGDGVSFAALPFYIGPLQYLRQRRRLTEAAVAAVEPGDSVVFRAPSAIAGQIEPALRRAGHPYGVEVLGDPYDVFAPGAVRHPLRRFFRWWFPKKLTRLCAGAAATGYVTEHALQRRYPPTPGAFTTYYSDVELSNDTFVAAPRPPRRAGPFTLVTVGSLAQMYKAPDVQIDALARLVKEGLDLRLVLVGDGKHRSELEARAAALGIAERVVFRGQLTAGIAVRAELDAADVFCLPSRTEGMPRAMIEAMARGLPCIGSTMGGIPELLPAADMVSPGDVAALAKTIRAVVTDPERMAQMSARNLARARDYQEDELRARRTRFYRALRERTEAWREHEGAPGKRRIAQSVSATAR